MKQINFVVPDVSPKDSKIAEARLYVDDDDDLTLQINGIDVLWLDSELGGEVNFFNLTDNEEDQLKEAGFSIKDGMLGLGDNVPPRRETDDD